MDRAHHRNVPWLAAAIAEVGVAQFPAGRSNPRITQYHDGTNIRGYDDKASWCSSFVNWCLGQAASWKGHVGFYLSHDARHIHLLGGNQLGEVREHFYPIESVLGYRWPANRDA